MSIQQRLSRLEQRTAGGQLHGTPIKPMQWSDGEHMAVVRGLGLVGKPILTITDAFIDKYREYIDKIRAEYNKSGITPDAPLIKAEPMERQQ